jgi:hypothetical protein
MPPDETMHSENIIVPIRFKSTGFIVVLDNRLYPLDKNKIFAYSLKDNMLKEYNKSAIISMGEIVEGSERIAALSKYQHWRDSETGLKQFSEIAAKQQREEEILKNLKEQAFQEALDKHKQYLDNLGIEYKGVKQADDKKHRVAHCWRCKGHLDNSTDVECGVCGWILCSCGACGCGFGM